MLPLLALMAWAAGAAHADPDPRTEHERFASFLTQGGFRSQLLVQNLRLNMPVTVTPALILGSTEVALDPIPLAPHSTATVDLNAALAAHGRKAARGAVVVRYSGPTYGTVSASVEASDEAHRVYLTSVAQSAEEFWYGTTLDAALWAPDAGTEGFVSLINTTVEQKTVQVAFLLNGHPPRMQEVVLAPHGQRTLAIDSPVKDSVRAGAGIRISFGGEPGDVVAEGSLLNMQTGFAKYLHFLDGQLIFPTSSLRTNFLLLGPQPREDGFPERTSFRAVAVVRNLGGSVVKVTPVIKDMQAGALRRVSLGQLALGADESRVIDFAAEQRAGELPADFHQGSLELVPDTKDTTLVAELINFDERSRGYVVGSSFSAYPSRATGSIWRIDGTFQTTVAVENTAGADDTVTLRLFSGADSYETTVAIPAGGLVKINLKELREKPGKDGRALVATSGTLSIAGANGARSALAFDKLIHSADEAEYVGLLANPCNFVTSINGYLTGSVNPFSAWIDAFWTDDSITTDSASPISSNSNLVSVSGSQVTFLPNGDGSTTLSFEEHNTACDICSYDNFFATAAAASKTVNYLSNSCTIDPNNHAPVMSAGWADLANPGSCALSDTSPPLPAGGKCVVDGQKNCYQITTNNCVKTFCPGDKRVVDGACTRFLDQFPLLGSTVPAGCS